MDHDGFRRPDTSRLAGSRCLVTGAAGFIGSHLCRALVALECRVTALVSDASPLLPPRLKDLHGSVSVYSANLLDLRAIEAALDVARPDYVFHLAAFTHVGRSFTRAAECMASNVIGTLNLLESLRRLPPRRLVFAGTSEIYGDVEVPFREDGPIRPISPYAVSKYAAERLVQIYGDSYGIPYVCLRPFNAYGPAQSPDRIVPETITLALKGKPVAITEGAQTREFNYVEDIADAFVLAAASEGGVGQVINVGCGQEISMRDLARKILEKLGWPVELKVGALPYRPKEIWRMYCDNSKARALLGWVPRVGLDEGLDRTIAWYERELADPQSPFLPL